jgi:3-oxoacyl-[acyl-carrier-protein] synthase II
MVATPRRTVLTGIGPVTPIGLSPETFWASLCDGRSGVRRIQSFDPTGLPTQIGGEVLGFDARDFIDKKDRKALKMMTRTSHLAVAAAQLALADAQVDRASLDPARFGVVLGSGTIPGGLEELSPAAWASIDVGRRAVDLKKWGRDGIPTIPPTWMLYHVPNMPACFVSILHNAQGPNNSITQTDLGGLLAVGEACRIIARDHADLFLVGGADTMMNPISMVRQCLFRSLSRRNESPESACRPFDRNRDGLVPGEGATLLVLEALDHARRRGARVYGEVIGFGAAFDRNRTGLGLARAVKLAMAEAGIAPREIDHVNAQGFSTVDADAWEARALNLVFGADLVSIPVFAAKSYFGTLGVGANSTELAASLLAVQRGLLPATLNYREPDPACPAAVNREPRPVTRPCFLKIAFTELGQCAAAVIRKWEE